METLGPAVFKEFAVAHDVPLVLGVGGMVLLALLPYQILRTYARWVYGAGLLLLLLVLAVGTRLRGSRSWFDLGWVYFQLVELVRLSLVVALAAYVDARFRDLREWPVLLLPFAMTGLYLVLIGAGQALA